MDGLVAAVFSTETRTIVVAALHFAMAGGVSIHVLLHKRDVPAAIGWIGMAWLAPVAGAALYLAFGINRVRRRARRMKRRFRDADSRGRGDRASTDPMERLKIAIGNITGQGMTTGRVVSILQCGDEAYPQMLAAIEGAQSCIRLCSYIFRADELGMEFIAALARAQRRGVRIRVLIDGFGGGFLLSRAYHRLRREGVPAARFLHSLLPWKMPFLNLRLHKKILSIDGRAAFVGGLNIGVENVMGKNPKHPVRDVHFELAGPLVQQIDQAFDDDWAFTTGEAAMETAYAAEPAQAEARALVGGPDQEQEQLVLVLLSAINAARHSIRIATPYFLPSEQLVTALQLATLRGVETHLVLPSTNNHFVVAWAAEEHIRPLVMTGCNIWRGPPPFDHSKLMSIDGRWGLIGSANWDMRSLRLNFELIVEFHDPDFAERLAGLIDKRRVQRVTLAELDKRRMLFRLRDAAARLAMPYI